MTTTIGPYTQGWARSFVNTYPGTRIWTTKMTRWDISTPAYATPECWPEQCWRIGKPNQLFTTTTRVRLPLIIIRDGTENISRPRTQQEIPTELRRLKWRARIYRARFANHRRLGPSGSTTNRRALTLHCRCHSHYIPRHHLSHYLQRTISTRRCKMAPPHKGLQQP